MESQRNRWDIQCNGWWLWLVRTTKRKLWGDAMHIEELNLAFGSCTPSKYINQGKTSRSSFSPKITLLSTKSLLPYYQCKIPWAWTMGYKDNTWFVGYLMAFAGDQNIHLGFSMCQSRSYSQSFKRTHQGLRALMLTLLGLKFFQKWHRILLTMGELGKPLTIIPFAACPLPWPRPLGSYVRY